MENNTVSAQQARREFLRKARKLAVYTPPMIMMLMHPGPHAIASGGGESKEKDKKQKDKKQKNK